MTQEQIFGQNAKWTSYASPKRIPLIRKEFFTKKVLKAELIVSGLGFFEGFLNGERIGKEYFTPLFSDSMERNFTKLNYPLPDKTSHRIYVCRYDVTELVKEGKNALCFLLGSGFFNKTKRLGEGDVSFSKKKFLCFSLRLVTENGEEEVFSDDNLKYDYSHIRVSDMYYGEKANYFRYRKKAYLPSFNDSAWKNPSVCEISSPLYFQTCPSDTIVETITPRVVKKTWNKTVYDVGQSVTGWAKVTGKGYIKVVYGEEIDNKKRLLFEYSGGNRQVQTDKFILTGGEGAPHFRWNAFRYFVVYGRHKRVKVEVVQMPFASCAEFKSDNEVLNKLFEVYRRTQKNNMHTGIPSDCPHRERLGYTGDGQLTTETALLNFDCREFFKKWFGDIRDCQDILSGHVQHTAPLMGGGGGPSGWGGAVIFAPYRYYSVCGEKEVLSDMFPAMERWIQYTTTIFGKGKEEYLIVRERDKGWCLGDWCTLDAIKIPEPFVNTYLFIKALDCFQQICDELGKENRFAFLREKCVESLRRNYYDENTNTYCDSVQGANFFACDLGLLSIDNIRHEIREVVRRGYLGTGLFGTEVAYKVLFEKGFKKEGISLLGSHEKGSYGYMFDHGATTLWEYWDGKKSHDHPMFGTPTKHLFTDVAGIRYDFGFRNVIVCPSLENGMKFVECSLTRPHAFVYVKYEKKENKTIYKVLYSGKINLKMSLNDRAYDIPPDNIATFEIDN